MIGQEFKWKLLQFCSLHDAIGIVFFITEKVDPATKWVKVSGLSNEFVYDAGILFGNSFKPRNVTTSCNISPSDCYDI